MLSSVKACTKTSQHQHAHIAMSVDVDMRGCSKAPAMRQVSGVLMYCNVRRNFGAWETSLTPQLIELSRKLLCVAFQLSGGLYTE